MKTCKECGEEFLSSRDWQEFCCQPHQQQWHNRQRKELRAALARAVPSINGSNGRDRGTAEEREVAKRALATFTQSLSVSPTEQVEQVEAPVLRRRF
jgi:hypothetical protein